MNFREVSAQLLKSKKRMETAVKNLKDEIAMLEEAKVSVKTSACSGAPITGTGGNRFEDRLIKLIYLCDELRQRKRIMQARLYCLDRGMDPLTEFERDLLYGFYVDGGKGAADRMMSRYHKERSTIYRDKDKALEHFAEALYGTGISASFEET